MTISLALSPVSPSTDDLTAVVVAPQGCPDHLTVNAQLTALPLATVPVAFGARLDDVEASPMRQQLTPPTSQRSRFRA